AHGVIPPGCVGYRPYNPYPTPGDRGDPDAARAVLASAGLAAAPVLTAVTRDSGPHRAVLESIAGDLRRIGVHLAILPVPREDYYTRLLCDPAHGRAGAWDVALAGWVPDWFQDNGRAVVQPLFETNDAPGTVNYGGYSSARVDRLIAAALRARDPRVAEELWHRVDRQVTADAAVVPLLAQAVLSPRQHSARLRNVRYVPQMGFFDITSVWLAS